MCNFCDFDVSDEYLPSENLNFKIEVDGTKQYYEIYLKEDYEYDHFICIEGTFSVICIPVEFCPICGRKL